MEENKIIEKFWVEQGGKPHMEADISFYESSWDMLMPVVEKMKIAADELWQNFEECEPLNFTIDVWKNEVKFVDTETGWWPFPIYTEKDGTVLQNTWQSVVDFIQWYKHER